MLTASPFSQHLSTHPSHDAVIVCLMSPLHTHHPLSGRLPSFLRTPSPSSRIEVAGRQWDWVAVICKMGDGVILECQALQG
jgi:hypothetical protein